MWNLFYKRILFILYILTTYTVCNNFAIALLGTPYDTRHVVIRKDIHQILKSPAIIADIGGTKARFALVYPNGAILNTWITSSQKFNSLCEMVDEYCKKLPFLNKKERIILSIPAFIDDNYIVSNDLKKIMGPLEKLYNNLEIRGFKDKNVFICNDVLAAAAGVSNLSPKDYYTIIGTPKESFLSALVIGCGTGYGQAIVYNSGDYITIYQNEAGFESLPAVSEEQIKILKNIQAITGKDLITKREIISGNGIMLLYKAIAKEHDFLPTAYSPEEILNDALNRENADKYKIANLTINYFTQFLGLSISNSILSNLADRVYLFGGMINSLFQKKLLDTELFSLWIAKGDRATLQKFLDKSNVNILLLENPTLRGLKRIAQQKISNSNTKATSMEK